MQHILPASVSKHCLKANSDTIPSSCNIWHSLIPSLRTVKLSLTSESDNYMERLTTLTQLQEVVIVIILMLSADGYCLYISQATQPFCFDSLSQWQESLLHQQSQNCAKPWIGDNRLPGPPWFWLPQVFWEVRTKIEPAGSHSHTGQI